VHLKKEVEAFFLTLNQWEGVVIHPPNY
jgi:hypothetical protein